MHWNTDQTTSIREPQALGEMPAVWTVIQSLIHILNLIHKWT